jgi:hypothetical protein
MNDARQLGTTWQSSWAGIPGSSAKRVTLSSNGRAITFAEVVDRWINDETFRAFFLAELRRTPFGAFFWELPPLQRDTLERPYEHNERALSPSVRPPDDEFLEPDVAVSFGIGDIEVEHAFFPRDITIQLN